MRTLIGRWRTAFGFLLLFLLWEAGVHVFGVREYILPPPSQVLRALAKNWQPVLANAGMTSLEIVAGYALAIVVSIPLAVGIVFSRAMEETVYPVVVFLQIVPKIAVAPLFIIWFGFGFTPKLLLVFLLSFFPIVIDAAVGLRSMSSEMNDLARSMGSSRIQIFTRFRLPTSLPYLFSGLKVAATLAIAGAVVGEFVGADKGLGYLLLVTNSNMETALMFATLVGLTLIGLLFFYSVEFLETLLIPWHVTHRVREESGTM